MLIFFAEILHTGRASIDMKHIKRDFSFKAWVRAFWVDLGGGAEVKIKFFQNMVMLHIIKADDAGNNMVANICPQTHPRPRGWGQKVKLYIFLKVVMLHIKLKLTTLTATW